MAELKVYCGTEFLGTVPRPEFRSDYVHFLIPGKNPGHPREYWAVRGYMGDPTESGVVYAIRPYWFGEDGEPPVPQEPMRLPDADIGRLWAIEFVMVVPEEGLNRELLHKIPGWRSAPPRRIIDLPNV